MIVKRNFNLIRVWQYIKRPMQIIIAWATIVWALDAFGPMDLSLNFTPVGVLGSALAIFIAFRNNSAYGRWWEARQIWGGIVNSSRILARLIITFSESHAHQPNYSEERSKGFQRSMVLRCIAWAHALRLHLRSQEHWAEIQPFLNDAEFQELLSKENKPNYLQLLIGREIYAAMADGRLGGFDSFQMEGQLLALANHQGAAERIKNTPLPRQYDYFTRLFVLLFSVLLPFGLLGILETGTSPASSWLVIPLSILIAGVFVIMERTGAANEAPFENLITDVPMTSLCNTIERDLKELLGTEALPERLAPQDGYLY
jgi:putative membrane protein